MNINEVSRGITHIEDLEIKEFLDVVKDLKKYTVTEKVDGSQILFGIDDRGFYTSRESKGGARVYSAEDYELKFSSSYMRSTHLLLEHVLPTLRDAGLRPGNQVEAEVLFGNLPNVVPYSGDTNYLIFLRTTEGTVNIDELRVKLCDQLLSVSLMSPYTDNGTTVSLREETHNWKFSRAPQINPTYTTKVLKEISRGRTSIIRYLNECSGINGLSNAVIESTPLNKIPTWYKMNDWKYTKELVKERKAEIKEELHKRKLLIKETLLDNIVRCRSSEFGPLLESGGWIEGVVLRSPTGKMVKIVDKNTFGVIREFCWKVRNDLTESARSVDGNLSFMGDLQVSLATALGHPELGTNSAKIHIKRSGMVHEGSVVVPDYIHVPNTKTYWINLLECKRAELLGKLDKYEKEKSTYRIDLEESQASPIVRAYSYSPDIDRRTKETFASIFDQIESLISETKQATTAEDLFTILIGKHIGNLT